MSINVVRIYNISEDEPIGFSFGGSYYLFQPKKGQFKREVKMVDTKIERANRFGEKVTSLAKVPQDRIVPVDTEKVVKNYLDVPGELGDWVKTGQGQTMTRGYLKTERELELTHDSEVQVLEKKKAALEAECKAMEEAHARRMTEIEAQTAVKAAQQAQKR